MYFTIPANRTILSQNGKSILSTFGCPENGLQNLEFGIKYG
jgi:hypothetical protein